MTTPAWWTAQHDHAYHALQVAAQRIAGADYESGRSRPKGKRGQILKRGQIAPSDELRRVTDTLDALGRNKISPEEAMAVLHEYEVFHARTSAREKGAAIKIRPEHAREVEVLISEFVAKYAKEVADHAKRVSPMRLRWDVFNKAVPFYPVVKRIYEYANDDHIDTLLRRIFKHAKEGV